MAQNTRAAVNMVEAGHVRVGPGMVLDPAFLVPRLGSFFYFHLFFSPIESGSQVLFY